jgi:hypothetical protein
MSSAGRLTVLVNGVGEDRQPLPVGEDETLQRDRINAAVDKVHLPLNQDGKVSRGVARGQTTRTSRRPADLHASAPRHR